MELKEWSIEELIDWKEFLKSNSDDSDESDEVFEIIIDTLSTRKIVRDQWLDFCNHVAGEIIC